MSDRNPPRGRARRRTPSAAFLIVAAGITALAAATAASDEEPNNDAFERTVLVPGVLSVAAMGLALLGLGWY